MKVVGALGLQVCAWLARVQDVSFFLSFARLFRVLQVSLCG